MQDRDRSCVYVNDEEYAKSGGTAGMYPLRVRTMDLNDECGQITHIFSDKTGTLTQNYMEFRRIIVNGVTYGVGTTEIGLARRRRTGADVTELERLAAQAEEMSKPGKRQTPHVLFIDGVEGEEGRFLLGEQGDLYGAGAQKDPVQAQALHLFVLQLATNHTVIKERVHDRESGRVIGEQLSASSPDEEAFVLAGGAFGYVFKGRVKDIITLEIRGQERHYRVVAVLPYSNARKMMSVVIEDQDATSRGDDAHAFILFSKGADSKILAKLDTSNEGLSEAEVAARDEIVSVTVEGMAEMARDGLRTLCFGYRYLDPSLVDEWLDDFAGAMSDLSEKTKKASGQPNRIDELMDRLEGKLLLQGATANEDKLQDEVSETIALLAAAGIKLYMCTGDKVETAINIAFAARLLSPEFELTVLTSEEIKDISCASDALAARADEVRAMAEEGREPPAPMALIIDEPLIDVALQGRDNRRNFLVLAEACRTVVCSRCRPDQKKRIVELIKRGLPGARTLAIGDGANDVDMIQEAHVGVGIAGAEGLQAANASDYAIGRFKYLQRLLLVHGRWNYTRLALLISYSFYKNLEWSFASWLYSIYNACESRRGEGLLSILDLVFVHTLHNEYCSSSPLPIARLPIRCYTLSQGPVSASLLRHIRRPSTCCSLACPCW